MDAPNTLQAKKIEKIDGRPTRGFALLSLDLSPESQFLINFSSYKDSLWKLTFDDDVCFQLGWTRNIQIQ